MRLRQICLVAPHLEPVISDIAAIMGLNVCYRDGNVAKYGLENALLPVDTILLEVVAPFQPAPRRAASSRRPAAAAATWRSSAATIPTSADAHANAMGVRTANVIDHAPYHGVQLHPRDCRAAFIEFNHTDGSDDVLGPYPPAGPGLAEIDPQGCDAGADRRRDAKPGAGGAGRALGQDHRHSREQRRDGEARIEAAQLHASASSKAPARS